MAAPALFWEIVRCPNLVGAMLGAGDCAKVVRAQMESGRIPAPWVGGLETAPLLFISADPGFERREVCPTAEWNDRAIEEFYFRRRARSPRRSLAAPAVDLSRLRTVAFWSHVRDCAAELLHRPRARIRPGIDYALTEIVHCRATDDEGLATAAPQCAKRYLERILAASAARTVIGFGDCVRAQLQRQLGWSPRPPTSGPTLVGPGEVKGRKRVFVFLPEPDPEAPCSPSEVLTREGLATLRRFVAGEDVGPREWRAMIRPAAGATEATSLRPVPRGSCISGAEPVTGSRAGPTCGSGVSPRRRS